MCVAVFRGFDAGASAAAVGRGPPVRFSFQSLPFFHSNRCRSETEQTDRYRNALAPGTDAQATDRRAVHLADVGRLALGGELGHSRARLSGTSVGGGSIRSDVSRGTRNAIATAVAIAGVVSTQRPSKPRQMLCARDAGLVQR